MYCNYCGKVIQEDANHCAYCGKRVGGVAARRSLVRPRVGRQIAGVCLALAEYFDLDVTLIRLVFVLSFIFGGFGFVAYIVGWIVIPNEPEFVTYAPPPQNANQQQAQS
jgi:phage shock protein C